MTLALVTHDLSIAQQAARTIHMKDGRIASDLRAAIAGA
jgi:predicted ABC-type transport system involved in lysophospholipase L1 biosynthesis ATPase subunit